MLGFFVKVIVILVVFMVFDFMLGVRVFFKRGRDEDFGVWVVVRRLVVIFLLVGVFVGWLGRLDVVIFSGCCRVVWVGFGDSVGFLVVVMGGFRVVVSGVVGVSVGLWEGILGVFCGNCSFLLLGVGSF